MDKPIVIISIIIGIIIVLGIIVSLVILKKKQRNVHYNDRINQIIDNLGGKDNIVNVTPKMSRVEFVLKNYDLINKDALKSLGVQGISKTSQKITLVVGNELAEDLNKTFKRS